MSERRALAFGAEAAAYDRARPGFPAAVAEVGGLPSSAAVLDLGAGTGKLTRVLARRFDRVAAVEPDARMRSLEPLAVAGTAEAIPLADASVDGVFVGEAFHWFDWPVALREIARVLRPGGPLVLVWNSASGETEPPYPDAVAAIAARYRPADLGEPGSASVYRGPWREAFAGTAFGGLEEQSFEHEQVESRDDVVDGVLSVSIYAMLAAERRQALADELRAALPETGVWRTPLHAQVCWARRV